MATTPSLSSYLPPLPADAQLFQRAALNRIGVTAATSTNIGWLSKNVSQLEVVSQLTTQDPINMFKFTLQQGDSINAHVTNIDEIVPVHFQLYDGSGTRVIADNQGKGATLDAYNALISTKGLSAKTGQYVVKVSYGTGAPKSAKQSFAFQLGSGTTFKNDYRTLASPTTISATLQAGGSIGGYNSSALTASLLTNLSLTNSLGTSLNIFSGLTSSILA